MRGQEFRARDKKVRKMTRDGLVEKNLTEGTQRRISSRTADISYKEERKENLGYGSRAPGRGQKNKPGHGAGPVGKAGCPETDLLTPWETDKMPEPEDGEKTTAPMRDAGDKPVFLAGPVSLGGRRARRGFLPRHLADAAEPGRLRETKKRRIRKAGDSRAGEMPGSMQMEDGKENAAESQVQGGNGNTGQAGERKEKRTADRVQKAERQAPRTAHGSGNMQAGREAAPGRESFPQQEGNGPLEDKGENTVRKSRGEKLYVRAQERVEKAGQRLEKAEAGIPVRRRLHLKAYQHGDSGKVRHRLSFEDEKIPENGQIKGGKAARGMLFSASLAAHKKIREVEKENAAVEAAHKAETAVEQGTAALLWRRRHWLAKKPYRELRRAERALGRAQAGLAYRELLNENPALRKKMLSRWLQRRKIKRKYAAAAGKAAKGAWKGGMAPGVSKGVMRSLAQFFAARRAVLGTAAAGIFLAVLFGSLFTSCASMLSGVESALLSSCYVADDKEINESALRYTELEMDLQIDIRDTEENFPDYDEYRYHIGEISHNPYELMGYLSAAFDDFTYRQVAAELERLFSQQYYLSREEVLETYTWTDEEGEEHEEEWKVLLTTLTVRPLADIIGESLVPGEMAERYGLYLLTCGNRQCYGNPFDFAWAGSVAGPYGYRFHPVTGQKELHRGVDIAAAEGTPVKAMQDGQVLSAGETGDYGLCVVMEGEDGYRSGYAHCSALFVNAGQKVRRGDVIASTGSTGSCVVPCLHLEVSHNGEYLNPYYFVDNGGTGYEPGGGAAGSPPIPEEPGEPMGDGSFVAMLAEAEKYLGYPYVWGGSSPVTSFDCSGFVSWVINQSGAGSVGRQTAQGLYNLSSPVSKGDLKPGDLVFFTGTYSSACPVSHVGIYVGGGRMIHAGDPVSYADITTQYWSSHFYCGGRLP